MAARAEKAGSWNPDKAPRTDGPCPAHACPCQATRAAQGGPGRSPASTPQTLWPHEPLLIHSLPASRPLLLLLPGKSDSARHHPAALVQPVPDVGRPVSHTPNPDAPDQGVLQGLRPSCPKDSLDVVCLNHKCVILFSMAKAFYTCSEALCPECVSGNENRSPNSGATRGRGPPTFFPDPQNGGGSPAPAPGPSCQAEQGAVMFVSGPRLGMRPGYEDSTSLLGAPTCY